MQNEISKFYCLAHFGLIFLIFAKDFAQGYLRQQICAHTSSQFPYNNVFNNFQSKPVEQFFRPRRIVKQQIDKDKTLKRI